MASHPFQRGAADSPRSPEYFSGANSPAGRPPTWTGVRKRIFDAGRIPQIAGAALVLLFVVGLGSLMFGGHGDKEPAGLAVGGVDVK